MDYTELVERLRECTAEQNGEKTLWHQAADAVEELSDKVTRAIGFWDSAEIATSMRNLNHALPNVTDPEWQKVHKEMGFWSPLADVYEALGVYDEPPEEEM